MGQGQLLNPAIVPDVDAIIQAAETLGIEIPESRDPDLLVPALRAGFTLRLKGIPKDDWIVCPKCKELTDDAEQLDSCPFCGDDGLASDEPEPELEVLDGADDDPEDDDAPEEPPTVNLDDDTNGDGVVDEKDAELDLDTDSDGDGVPDSQETPDPVPTPEPTKPEKATRVNRKAEKAKEAAAAAPVVVTPDVKVETSEETSAPIVTPDGDMLQQLNREKHLIKKAQTDMVKSGYALGCTLLRINNGELWKADGVKTFAKFLETVGVSKTLAYDLMGLVEKFDEKTFMEVGRKRLLAVVKADPESQPKLLDRARDPNVTRSELEAEAAATKPAATVPVKEHDRKAPAPAKEDMVTLVAKVGGRPVVHKFLDRKTKEELQFAAENSYVQIRISETVNQVIALKRDEAGNVTGLAVAFIQEAKAPADKK